MNYIKLEIPRITAGKILFMHQTHKITLDKLVDLAMERLGVHTHPLYINTAINQFTKQPKSRPKIYVCHAYSGDPEANRQSVAKICKKLLHKGFNPIAPQLSLHYFIDEATERDSVMAICLELVESCDELWTFGDVSAGMRDEICHAETLYTPIPVKKGEEELK